MSIFNDAWNACKKGSDNIMNGAGYVANKAREAAQNVCKKAKEIVGKVKCKLGFHKKVECFDTTLLCGRCHKRLDV